MRRRCSVHIILCVVLAMPVGADIDRARASEAPSDLVRAMQGKVALNAVLTGMIVDETGRPVSGANLIVSGTSIGTATDSDGRFRLENLPQTAFELEVSAIGFHTVRLQFHLQSEEERDVVITLIERVLESDEVVVAASRREQPALSVPVSVETLSAEDLRARNVVELDDALRTLSGVHLQGNQINIRGSSGFAYNTGSRVLVMLDGMPLLAPDTDGVPYEALPMSEIQRIEVLKGPGSALYGGGALGGIINLITRDFPDRPETRLRTYAGSYQPVRHRIWREKWPGGDRLRQFFGAAATHSRRLSDSAGMWLNLSYRDDPGYLDFSEARFFHAFGKFEYRPAPQYRIDLLAGLMNREKDNFLFWNSGRNVLRPGSLSLGDSGANSSGAGSPTGTSDTFGTQITVLPTFTHLVGSSMYYTVKGRLFGLILKPVRSDGSAGSISDGTLGFRYGAETQWTYVPSGARRLTAGLSADALTTESSFFVTSDGDRLSGQPEGAAFLHIEESLSNRLELVAGLRYDVYQIDAGRRESQLSPKISASYELNSALTIRTAAGDGFRVPSFAERFTDNQEFFPVVRNLSLRPERSRSVEMGIRAVWSHTGFGRVRADAAVFRSIYDELIEPKLVADVQAFQFINLTQARITGGEVTVEWDVAPLHSTVSAGYTLLNTENSETGMSLASRPRHQLVASVDSRPADHWETGLDWRYISEPERIDSDFALFVSDADLLAATNVVDLRASWNNELLRIALILDNALHYHYIDRPALLGQPRTATVQVEISL